MPSLVPFGDERGIRAELFNIFLNFLVKAGDESRHQHDDTYTQHNAEDRQRAAELVGPQGVQRLFQVFAVCLSHILLYPSARKASMGSSLAARMAGKIPKKRPTPVATHNDRITALSGVSMGNENSAFTRNTSE